MIPDDVVDAVGEVIEVVVVGSPDVKKGSGIDLNKVIKTKNTQSIALFCHQNYSELTVFKKDA